MELLQLTILFFIAKNNLQVTIHPEEPFIIINSSLG